MSVRALVLDARDPPLGGAERAVAIVAPEAVLRGLGGSALAHPRAKLWIDTADEDVAHALMTCAERLQAQLQRGGSTRAADVLRLRPTALAESSWRDRGVERHVIAVAGAVASPTVFAAPPGASVDELVARARPDTRAWIALWGGAQGTLIGREATVGELIASAASRLLLVLPAGHALARRARLPLSAWLRRAQSACASCAICAPACPESIPVPEILRVLTAGTRGRSTARLPHAVDCTSCGACDLACPQAISPARVVADLGHRLRAGGVAAPVRRRRTARALDLEIAVARLGLRRYRRPIAPELVPLS